MKSVYGQLRRVLLSVLFAIALVVSASAAFRDVPEDHWCNEESGWEEARMANALYQKFRLGR